MFALVGFRMDPELLFPRESPRLGCRAHLGIGHLDRPPLDDPRPANLLLLSDFEERNCLTYVDTEGRVPSRAKKPGDRHAATLGQGRARQTQPTPRHNLHGGGGGGMAKTAIAFPPGEGNLQDMIDLFQHMY